MQKIDRYYFPDGETHFPGMINKRGFYQEDTFDEALKYCKERKVFIDVGAHVGLWTLKASSEGFSRIYAFEPHDEHCQCFIENCKGIPPDISLYNLFIGNGGNGELANFIPGNSGAWKTVKTDSGKSIIRLDSILPPMINCDLIKIDVEGFEAEVLQGAARILKEQNPVIVIEQKSNRDAISYLNSTGYKQISKVRKDYIFIKEEK